MKKESKENSETLKQIKTIISDPSFVVAEDDKDFLCSDEARGVRLQLDYLKAEVKMQKQGIDHRKSWRSLHIQRHFSMHSKELKVW